MSDESYCLTSSDALRQIVAELEELLHRHDSAKSFSKDIANAFTWLSPLPWPYVVLSFVTIVALFASTTSFGSPHLCALFLLFNLASAGLLSVWDVRKKTNEISTRLLWCIDNLRDVYENSTFTDCLALDQLSDLLKNCDTAAISISASHSVSYVHRRHTGRPDESLNPIPTTLLATGDLISLWPGQEAPTKLQCAQDECFILERGELFEMSHISVCSVAKNEEEIPQSHKFKLLESPIVNEIEQFLSSIKETDTGHGQRTPPTVFERQRILLLSWFLKFVIPLMLVVVFITSTFRFLFLPVSTVPIHDFSNVISILNETAIFLVASNPPLDPVWYVYFLQTPALVCMPLLPVLLPGLLILLVTIGEAKTISVCKTARPKYDKLLTTPTTFTMSSQAVFFRNEGRREMHWRKLLPKMLWGNDGTIFHRNAGVFVPLGSLTALCCVDKEGILSWFNPIAEKVFFFKHNPDQEIIKIDSEQSHKETFEGAMPPVKEESEDVTNGEIPQKNEISSPGSEDQKVLSETLSLSQDSHDPCRVRFDDVNWEDHLSSLKPIGLNIVLNLCSCRASEKEFQFPRNSTGMEIMEIFDQKKFHRNDFGDCNVEFPHEQVLRAIAYSSDCLPPGMRMVRKGLCSLAEIMGFSQNIKLTYSHQQKFTTFKKPFCPSSIRLSAAFDQNASFLIENAGSLAKRNKWKQYLPHVQGTVLEDFFGDKQVLLYGTGDLITEQCKDIWDGKEIQPMTTQDRRKAIDFYQRSSVAGQCIAFAYVPLPMRNFEPTASKNENSFLVNLSKTAERKHLVENLSGAEILNNMIFLGMTTLQHQARFSVCQMVETLDRACIRFVYFSADNEVRSRVFAEKMGLETGWNCHISLSARPNDSTAAPESKITQLHNRSESSKSRSSSEGGGSKHKHVLEEDDAEDLGGVSSHLLERTLPRTQSESSTADSLFNVSNRAKLPRGIENIVPHIENVDNVPLLVPLFTDVTSETAGQIIQIMQNYGEVVCCVGSSDCIRNMSVFHQANVSLAFEPVIHPSVFGASSQSSQDSISSNESLSFLRQRKLSPIFDCIAMETARKLHCFSCSLLLSRDSGLSVIASMITQARHFLCVLRIFFAFLIKCEVALSLLLLFSHILLLPAPLTPMDVFWLSVIVLPFLSLTLLASPPDHDLMTWANEKVLTKENPVTCFTVRQTAKRYTVKFLPSIVVLVACYGLSLHSCCADVKNLLETKKISFSENTTGIIGSSNTTLVVQCYPHFLITVSSKLSENQSSESMNLPLWYATNKLQQKLRTIQLTIACFFVLYLCIVSIGYVHRWKRLTDTLPCSNKLWAITVPVLIICQIVGAIIVLSLNQNGNRSALNFSHVKLTKVLDNWEFLNFGDYQSIVWVILTLWTVPCSIFNELWKWREIKMWNRSQKRARLDFGTKLGMNSPF